MLRGIDRRVNARHGGLIMDRDERMRGRAIELIINFFLFCAVSAVGMMLNRPPETASLAVLEELKVQRDIEKLRVEQEVERRNTAVTLVKLERQRNVGASKAVQTSAVLTAIFWQGFPVWALIITTVGGVTFALTRRVMLTSPLISGAFPRRDALLIAQTALRVADTEALARAEGFTEQISRGRVADSVNVLRALRSGGGRAGVTADALNERPLSALPELRTFSFDDARRDFANGCILLGYDEQRQPVRIPLDGFVSGAFGGGSGSGKTTKLRFFMTQLIQQGINVEILDAHKGHPQSLVNSLGSLAARENVKIHNPFEIHRAVADILNHVEGVIAGKHDAVQTVYVLEEIKPLRRACAEIETVFDVIANEGRKFEQYLIASSQTWEASMFGKKGSAARDACVLKMASRMPREQGKILFKDGETANVVSKLKQDQMFAESMQFSGVVTVPFGTTADGERN